MTDKYGRKIEYMRLSITDRCNLRCRYCMPDGIEKIPMDRIITYEEILKICEAAVQIGINKFKVTGGEPLVRLGSAEFIGRLKRLPGVEQVTMTTNGIELPKHVDELKAAGLDAVNISLDSLDPDKYRYITQLGNIDDVLEGIRAATKNGIRTKINCLLQRGFNENEITDFADLAFETDIDVRFIELMPVGIGDSDKGISNEYVLSVLKEKYPDLEPDESIHGNGPAVYYKRPGIRGCVGLISAMGEVFCDKCNKIRLTSQGVLKPCLGFNEGVDLKPVLDGSIDDIRSKLEEAVMSKPERHLFNEDKSASAATPMSEIGG